MVCGLVVISFQVKCYGGDSGSTLMRKWRKHREGQNNWFEQSVRRGLKNSDLGLPWFLGTALLRSPKSTLLHVDPVVKLILAFAWGSFPYEEVVNMRLRDLQFVHILVIPEEPTETGRLAQLLENEGVCTIAHLKRSCPLIGEAVDSILVNHNFLPTMKTRDKKEQKQEKKEKEGKALTSLMQTRELLK